MAKIYPLFSRPCVVAQVDNEESILPAVMVTATALSGSGTITLLMADDDDVRYQADDINPSRTGREIDFTVDGVQYFIRELREEDGEWLSTYKMMLPNVALAGLIRGGSPMVNSAETLTAYVMDDSPYAVGLVYQNSAGRWSRVDGDWNLISSQDDTFDDMIAIDIHPPKADDFIDLYDNNYVSIDDLHDYTTENSIDNGEQPDGQPDVPGVDNNEPNPDAAPAPVEEQ